MTITYKQRYPTNLLEVQRNLQSLRGHDLVIFQRQNGQTYCNPIRATVEKTCRDFVVCRHKSGRRDCFQYADFYSGNLIYDVAEGI